MSNRVDMSQMYNNELIRSIQKTMSIVDGCRNRTRDVGNKFLMGISCICHNVCVTMHALAHMASFYQLKWIYTYMCPTSMFYTG